MKASAVVFLFFLAASCFAEAGGHGPDRPRCYDCHYRLPSHNIRPSFNEGIGEVCSRCHTVHHGKKQRNSHVVYVLPSMKIPKDMPLDVRGKLSCVTCHSYHIGHDVMEGSKRFLLRREPGKTFCYACHKKALF